MTLYIFTKSFNKFSIGNLFHIWVVLYGIARNSMLMLCAHLTCVWRDCL